MAGQDGQGAVDLFGQHGLRERVWQGHGPEREQKVGAGAGLGGPAVCGADSGNNLLAAGVAQYGKAVGELL